MKTDNLFYELFRCQPRSLIELAQLDLEGEYVFDSVTFKSTEKRLDGLFRPVVGTGPNLFVEVQGYDDTAIYWRLFREICTWHEQTGSTQPFLAIVLFLDPKYDPGPPSWVVSESLLVLNLEPSLRALGEQASVLTVLKPLVTPKRQLPKQLKQWQAELRSLKLSAKDFKQLMELLEYAIWQRLPHLTLEELQHMLHLTPLEQTVAGQQLISRSLQQGLQQGLTEGVQQGREQGELIGQIQLLQRLLKQRVTPKNQLLQQSRYQLKQLLKQLNAQL